MVFHTLICSKLDYEARAWQPWLFDTSLSCLDCLQNRSIWLITGQVVSPLLEPLRLEADIQSHPTCSNRYILKAREKAARSTDNHPKHIALDANILQCLQNLPSFRHKAEELSTLLPPNLQHRQNIIHFPSLAWQHSSSQEGRISIIVPGITGQANDTNLKRQCSLTTSLHIKLIYLYLYLYLTFIYRR